MSEDDLELLVTLDDPGEAQEEDTFKHLQPNNTLEYWLGQLSLARGWHDQQAEAISNDDSLTRWRLARAIGHAPYQH